MGLESTIGVAKVGTNSVRTTVPEGITEFLGVKAGDKLEWKMEVHDNERAAIVTKKAGSAGTEIAGDYADADLATNRK